MHLYFQLLSLLVSVIPVCLIGCTSLSNINVNFISWNAATNFTSDWVKNVKNTSACVFTCPSGLAIKRGDSYIPSNWTINKKVLPLPLYFTALLDNSTILLLYNGTSSTIKLYYNKNDTEYVFFEPNVTKVTLNKGLFVKFRNTENTFSTLDEDTALYIYYTFKMFGKITAAGNINSLINYSNLTDYCYYNLFSNCSSLITAPELPASSLAYGCYYSMFRRLHKFKCCT